MGLNVSGLFFPVQIFYISMIPYNCESIKTGRPKVVKKLEHGLNQPTNQPNKPMVGTELCLVK